MSDTTSRQDVVFLRGAKTVLRPIDKKRDAELMQRWINDPETRQFLSGTFPITLEGERSWVDSLEKSPDRGIHLIIETHDGTPIGTMGFHYINWVNRVAGTGALIGEKEYWGRGYGTDAKMALLFYAFQTLNLRKICSDVLASNPRSLAYLKKTGHKEVGRRIRDVYRYGHYVDLILVEVFKPDFMKVWRVYKKKHGL